MSVKASQDFFAKLLSNLTRNYFYNRSIVFNTMQIHICQYPTHFAYIPADNSCQSWIFFTLKQIFRNIVDICVVNLESSVVAIWLVQNNSKCFNNFNNNYNKHKIHIIDVFWLLQRAITQRKIKETPEKKEKKISAVLSSPRPSTSNK